MCPQWGHGTWYRRWSLFRYPPSMRHRPFVPGVEVLKTLRLRPNVLVRSSARPSGSPSPSTSSGQFEISSANRYLMGIERRPAALFAPPMIRIPPGKSFSSMVLPPSRERFAVTFAASVGVAWIIGLMRCFE